MTATVPGELLAARLKLLSLQLGEYPHPGLEVPPRGSKGSRLLKVLCPSCGCIIRMTAKWIDTIGTPTCGCGDRMHLED